MKHSALISPEYRINTVEKAIEAIELLSDTSNDNNNLVYMAEKLGLSRNKTFRILSTLTELGIAERDVSRGTYHLGITAFEFARKLLRPASVINNAHPVIEELSRRHQEDVYLTVMCDKEVLFLDMAVCKQQVKTMPLVGMRYPFFATAAGKVMAAMGVSLDHVGTLLGKSRRNGSNVRIDLLEQELAQIRNDGVAVDEDSLGEGVVSIAVPFKDYAGKVLGAITLLGPSFRLLSERVEQEIIPSMQEFAEQLSFRFGYSPA
ncbi:transcriptional regulator KdgR [Geobacter sp. OR-1]|uniref:IclR family transcriptional regulator n=1 Tax=Geobacter sp. OR-1 TaxID=1266765 RepID=UPI000543A7BD|nr:IclR family transcriptional regulator [Geobacter sp. OR-1]GAM11861.1 transcriptional regulator KdgR [Geobacter sp. OR-1]